MRLSEIITYYSRPDISNEIIRVVRSREVAPLYGLDKFGKRPDILQFQDDINSEVRKGATSFHCSEERWSDPLQLKQESTKAELDNLRIGWDMILDIDCPWFDIATITAKLLMQALEYHGIKSYSIKFSGNKGWHIGIPAEAFPKTIGNKSINLMYPDAAQIITKYLSEFIKPSLENEILALVNYDIKKLADKLGKKKSEFYNEKEMHFLPNFFSQVDIALVSSRHLFRVPYSLHEKTWLVSLPIKPEDLAKFEKNWAKPEIVKITTSFLDPAGASPEEGAQLIIQALDWKAGAEHKVAVGEARKFEYEEKVPEDAFPPCMKCIFKGLEDGRKRSLFATLNFLRSVGWGWPDIEAKIKEWNNKNAQPLKIGYVMSQIAWHKKQTVKVPPQNCRQFYKEIGVCTPDYICDKIKNPLTYPRFRLKASPDKKSTNSD